MSTFAAKYHSTCADCGGGIEPGDEVAFAGNKVVHANGECEHGDAALEPASTGRVCTGCWTEKSVSGACECERG